MTIKTYVEKVSELKLVNEKHKRDFNENPISDIEIVQQNVVI